MEAEEVWTARTRDGQFKWPSNAGAVADVVRAFRRCGCTVCLDELENQPGRRSGWVTKVSGWPR